MRYIEYDGTSPIVSNREHRYCDDEIRPPSSLTQEVTNILSGVSLVHVVLDHNKPDLATGQIQLVRETWAPHLRDLRTVYATNGPSNTVNSLADLVVRRVNPKHYYIGVTDLVANSFAEILDRYPETDYIGCASADAWILEPSAFLSAFANFASSENSKKPQELITTYCGGIGLRGALRYPEYYMRNKHDFYNCFGGTGLMTEFFMMSRNLASSFINWNNLGAGQDCYANFHDDPRTAKYLSRGQGLVETHFRWIASRALGRSFGERTGLLQPRQQTIHGSYPYVIPSESHIYPCGVGYTSTHDECVRRHNVTVFQHHLPLDRMPFVARYIDKS